MTCSLLEVPFLAAPTPFEIESRHNMVKSYKYYQTPVDEAVQAVKDAQDDVSKGIWEGLDEV